MILGGNQSHLPRNSKLREREPQARHQPALLAISLLFSSTFSMNSINQQVLHHILASSNPHRLHSFPLLPGKPGAVIPINETLTEHRDLRSRCHTSCWPRAQQRLMWAVGRGIRLFQVIFTHENRARKQGRNGELREASWATASTHDGKICSQGQKNLYAAGQKRGMAGKYLTCHKAGLGCPAVSQPL